MTIFHSYVNVYQRVALLSMDRSLFDWVFTGCIWFVVWQCTTQGDSGKDRNHGNSRKKCCDPPAENAGWPSHTKMIEFNNGCEPNLGKGFAAPLTLDHGIQPEVSWRLLVLKSHARQVIRVWIHGKKSYQFPVHICSTLQSPIVRI